MSLPTVEIPTMKSLFIEMLREGRVLASGSAFLAANDQQSHCALITARHNVTGINQETEQPLHSMGAIPDFINVYFHVPNSMVGSRKKISLPLYRPDGTPFWIEHPRFGSAADVVALNLKWGTDVLRLPYYMRTNLDRPGLVIEPAEPVSVIGFPFGLSVGGGFPIWATGFLAQDLSLVTEDDPVFLIDCRARPGQSGSAVLAYRPDLHRKKIDDKVVSVFGAGKVWEFLGIYCGRINNESDLGRVWRVSAIEAVLDAAAERMAQTAT